MAPLFVLTQIPVESVFVAAAAMTMQYCDRRRAGPSVQWALSTLFFVCFRFDTKCAMNSVYAREDVLVALVKKKKNSRAPVNINYERVTIVSKAAAWLRCTFENLEEKTMNTVCFSREKTIDGRR